MVCCFTARFFCNRHALKYGTIRDRMSIARLRPPQELYQREARLYAIKVIHFSTHGHVLSMCITARDSVQRALVLSIAISRLHHVRS